MIAVSIALFLVLLFSVGKFRVTADTYTVRVLFNFISGLETNAPVRFAGAEVGKVEKIEILDVKEQEQEKEEGFIAVTIRVDKKARLSKDSEAIIDTLGMMGEKYIELSPGSKGSPLLESGDTIRGTDPIAMSELFKKVKKIGDELDETIIKLKSLITEADDILKCNRGHIDDIFANVDQSSIYFKAMTRDLRWHPWKLLAKGKEHPMTEDGKFKDEKFEEKAEKQEAKDREKFGEPEGKPKDKFLGIF